MSKGHEPPKLVVGVGASTGGLDAFRALVEHTPADAGMAFLLVQHLDPHHESLLSEILEPHTGLRVERARDGRELERNCVYVIQPDTALSVRNGYLRITEARQHRGMRLPVDHLFRSLADEYGPLAVGIVLSGAGSDGSNGAREIKAAGGLVLAQTPGTCAESGMPQTAIESGVVDLVLDIEQMPRALERFASLPRSARLPTPKNEDRNGASAVEAAIGDEMLEELGRVVEQKRGFDLGSYKSTTAKRRVLRRVTLSGSRDTQSYLDLLRTDPDEQDHLIRDMLISVTDFFRDAAAYRALRAHVIEPLVRDAEEGSTLRVWVPGCATGEEVYSIGIEMLMALERRSKRLALQIFATDMDRDALERARRGVYPESIADDMAAEQLDRFFTRLRGGGYRVRARLRDRISFAVHDLTRDPPFSRMDLVSCRNLLMYLAPESQKHALRSLHFALEPECHLFLGTSESTGPQSELFTTIDKAHRIYRKVGRSTRPLLGEAPKLSLDHFGPNDFPSRRHARPADRGDEVRKVILESLAPPTIVVSEEGGVTFSHGELGPYLRIPEGDQPRLDLASMLRPEIATRARGALHRCRRSGAKAEAVSSLGHEGGLRVRILAFPAPKLGNGTVILSFEAIGEDASPEGRTATDASSSDRIITDLERELQATREDLRSTVEELEISNEELRSSNEQSMSMNEELQSANEELEATTEELRSLNEELSTVNAQLRDKIRQLQRAHDDLHNFFASTNIATIFLDVDGSIERFTPSARELLDIGHADRGRRVRDIARPLLQEGLQEEAIDVLDTLTPRSREIRTEGGRWISRQVLPYRTESRQIEGVVVTFVDVTELTLTTERLALRERQQRVVARIGIHALRESDLRGFMEQVVREVQQTLDTDFCTILELQPGRKSLLLRAAVGLDRSRIDVASVSAGPDSQAGYTLKADEAVLFTDIDAEKRFSPSDLLAGCHISSGISCVIRDGDEPYGVLEAHTREKRDFTDEDAYFLQAVANVVGSAIARYQSRRRLAVDLDVAHVLAEAREVEPALESVLSQITSALSAAVGEVWWPSSEDGDLRRDLLHTRAGVKRAHLFAGSGDEPLRLAEDLVRHVFEAREAASCRRSEEATVFAMHPDAGDLGLTAGFGLPIQSSNEVLGVLTVFSKERLLVDRLFLKSLDTVGRAIGDFITRTHVEQRARRLATITESSHDAILSYGVDGLVTDWLVGSERLFGYSAEEMVGSSIEKIVPEDRREELWAVNARIMKGEVVEPYETERLRADGSLIEVSVRSSPIESNSGELVGIASTDRDISRRKETERRLVEADEQKDEFLAMLGHELRNPLSAIRSASELLDMIRGEDPRLERTHRVLERQTSHMAKLLDGLLDVSRMIRSKIEIERAPQDLADICDAVVADVEERTRRRELEIVTDICARPVCVSGDRVRLAQVVDNLLSNAVKYTPDGGVVRLVLREIGDEAELEVSDSGVGIEGKLLPHVFDAFRQSEQTLDRASGGLGLGLALVKSLTELHDGEVEAKSEGRGRGATFVVRLPLIDEAPKARSVPPPEVGPLDLLLIEDNEDSATMLKAGLEARGHEVRVAHRGEDGIASALRQPPDVILCDLGLPDGVSGFDVVERLRKDARTREIPIFAFTGYGRPEDRARCLAAGFTQHLTKPIDMNALIRAIDKAHHQAAE